MVYKMYDNVLGIRLDPGDSIKECIVEACTAAEVGFGSISGVGATRHIRFGAGDETKDSYKITEIDEKMEIIHMNGNVSMKDGKVFPHIHVTLAGQGGTVVFGGHLEEATIFSTGEIFITNLGEEVKRTLQSGSGNHPWYLLDI